MGIKTKKNKFFIRFFLILLFSVITTALVISSIFLLNFEGITINNIQSASVESLRQISYSAKFMQETAKTTAVQLFLNNQSSKLLNVENLDYIEINTLLQSLSNFFYPTPYTHSIYLYNSKADVVYSDSVYPADNFPDQDIVNIIKNYKEYKQLAPIPRKIPAIYNTSSSIYNNQNVYTFMFYNPPTTTSKPDAVVVVNIYEAWVRNIISSVSHNAEKEIIIIDKEGTTVFGNATYPMSLDISQQSFVRNILSSKEDSGYITADIDGKKQLIVYVSSTNPDWTFIKFADYQQVTGEINRMRKDTIIISIIVLISGLLISFSVYKKLYNPFNKILSKLDNLENENKNNFYTVKQDFLRKLLKDHNYYNYNIIKEKFAGYDIRFNIEKPLVLILLKIDNFHNICLNNSTKDIDLYKYAIMNIAQEIFSSKFETESIDIGEDHIVIIFNTLTMESYSCASIAELIERTQNAVSRYFQFSISAAVSSLNNNVSDIPMLLYRRLLETSYDKVFYDHQCIIFADDINKMDACAYKYPFHKEQSLIESLILGKINAAKAIYTEIINESFNYPYFILRMIISKITFALKITFEYIAKDSTIPDIFNPNTLLKELEYYETAIEINKRFMELFDNIGEVLKQNKEGMKNAKQKEFILSIMDIIDKNVFKQDLCLNLIADKLNMSSVYIGRIFKEYTSKSISDYILEKRINKAMELLTSTSYTVEEIASMVGYTNTNYFYTKFKNIHGITPNEFRKVSQIGGA